MVRIGSVPANEVVERHALARDAGGGDAAFMQGSKHLRVVGWLVQMGVLALDVEQDNSHARGPGFLDQAGTVVDFPPPVVPRMAVWRGKTSFLSEGMLTMTLSWPTTRPRRMSPAARNTFAASVSLSTMTGL